MVKVDARIVAAAEAEKAALLQEHAPLISGGPLVLEKGVATVGEVEIAFDPKEEMLEVRMGKEKGRMTKLELYQFCFGIFDPAMRDELIPVRHTEMTTITKVHTVKLKKAMPQGGLIKVRCHTNIPTTVVDGLRGIVERENRSAIHTR